jgi:predicted DsbA family dithiol-disulfide isomerase
MKLAIVIDVVCPWCFVGKREIEKAMAMRPGVISSIEWRPFQLAPDTPAEGVDRKLYYQRKFGDTAQLDEMRRHLKNRGEALGIDFDFDSDCLIANTLDAHRLIRWAGPAGCQDIVVEALMEQYFEKAAFLGDKALLCDIAEGAGMDRELVTGLLTTDRDADLVRQDIQQANNMGVSGVPFFIFDGKAAVSGAQSSEVFVQIFGQLSGEVQIAE